MAQGVERLGPRLWRTTAKDGRSYLLRPIEPSDAPALMAAFERQDPEDRRMRMLSNIRRLPRKMAEKLCTVDPERDVALILVREDAPGELFGGARLMRDPKGGGAEFAVSVASPQKGLGLGRRALATALEVGREMGIGFVWGTISRSNVAMRALARKLGMIERPDPDDPALVRAELSLAAPVAVRRAS